MNRQPNSKERPSILVVDDERFVRRSMCDFLEDLEYRVIEAASGSQALSLLGSQTPDLMLLDLRMPGISGLEVLRLARGSHPDLPVIVVSGTGLVKDVVEALRSGAWDYLTKPIEDLAMLQHAVKGAILKARLIVEHKNHSIRLEHEVAERTRELRELSMHMETIREQEKRRIAQEIHDELGMTLTALNTEVSLMIKALARSEPELEARAVSMKTLVSEALGTSRRIISDLRPSILDTLGLVAALEWQASEFAKRYGIGVRFNCDQDEVLLSEGKTIGLFRIFQEALTNIAKHAEASMVTVHFRAASGIARLDIEDDGIGFDASGDNPKTHGLRGMRERIANFAGSFHVDSGAGKGTRISVKIPVEAEETDDAPNLDR